jgi:hypothetical protein
MAFRLFRADNLLCSLQTTFYWRFIQAHPGVAISQTSFLSLKPYFVQPLRNRNVCCVEIAILLDSLNCMRDNVFHGRLCHCNCVVCGEDDDDAVRTLCSARVLTYHVRRNTHASVTAGSYDIPTVILYVHGLPPIVEACTNRVHFPTVGMPYEMAVAPNLAA